MFLQIVLCIVISQIVKSVLTNLWILVLENFDYTPESNDRDEYV